MGRLSRASIFPVMTPSPVVLLSIERAGGTALPGRESYIEATTPIGVLNAIKCRTWSVRYSRWKMNATDEPHGA